MSAHDSRAVSGQGEQLLTLGVLLSILLIKLLTAASLPLLGDEAFYWWESRYPAWSYSDLPPLTAWLLGLSVPESAGYLGARWAFLALGTLLPLLVWLLARRFGPAATAWWAALAALALPLVAVQGLLAVPDVLINVLAVSLALLVVRLAVRPSTGVWIAAGVIAALGLMTHFRFAVPLAAAGLAVVTMTGLRRQLSRVGPWLALAIAGSGLLPTLLFNLSHDFASLRFQFADRHPWSFQIEGLLQPVVQLLVSSPLMFLLLVGAAIVVCRQGTRHGGAWGVLAWMGVAPPLVYFVLGLFADQERTSFHWPLVGYLVLCAAIPTLVAELRRSWPVWLAVGSGLAAGLALMLGLAWLAADPQRSVRYGKLYPDNALGWPQAAAMVEAAGHADTLVADNFMLAAELAFELGRRQVYSLDHPLNEKHGRASQLRLWQLDGDAVPLAVSDGVLMVEETALDLARRPAWAREICARFADAQLVEDRLLYGGRKRFRSYRLGGDGPCDHPAFAYLDTPARDSRLASPLSVAGWAFDDDRGIATVTVLIDGQPAGVADYGLPRPGVAEFFPGSTDPNHPDVGFTTELTLPPGSYRLSLELHSRDGHRRQTRPIEIHVEANVQR